jgi:hypothetical protein
MRVLRYWRRTIDESWHLGCDAASLGVFRRFEGICYLHVAGFKVHEEHYDCNYRKRGPPFPGVESNSEQRNIRRCLLGVLEGDRRVALCLPTPDITTQRNAKILWSPEWLRTVLAGIEDFNLKKRKKVRTWKTREQMGIPMRWILNNR